MPEQRQAGRTATVGLSAVMIAIGIAMLVRTILAGGGPLSSGVILGILFAAAGAGRLYLARSRQ